MRLSVLTVLAVAVAAACASGAAGKPAAASGAAHRPAPAASAGETFTVGTLRVERQGVARAGARPVVLVPGLASGSWAWAETAAWLREGRAVYLVTLAGFDGLPPPEGDAPYLDRAAASLAELVRSRMLDRPIVVGHSLGGLLALRLAAEHPELVGGAVTLDGLPVFPGAERADAAGRAAMGAGFRERIEGLSPEAFLAQQVGYMKWIGVVDPATAERLAALSARSDPRAVGRYAGELLAFDLRPELPRATVPLLALVPYHAPDHAAPPLVMTEDQKLAYYRGLLAGAPDLTVVALPGARHFAMIDQPAAFRRALESFLAAHP